MDLLEAIHRRRAVRSFTERTVDPAILTSLVAAAIEAPSAMNLQPWRFLVLHGRSAIKRVSDAAKAHLLQLIDAASPFAKYRDELADPDFNLFYEAPAVILVCAEGPAVAGAVAPNEDCCLAAQNLMLAAVPLGLGTCWIGFARPWLGRPEAKRMLGMRQEWAPVAPIAVGYPAEEPKPVGRRPAEILWHPTR